MSKRPLNVAERRVAAALAPFGWACSEDFWQRYYSDAWVFNLANAVEALSQHVDELLAHPDHKEQPK